MQETDLLDNLYWNLLRVSARSKRGLVKLAEEHDLTIMQLFALCSMEKGQPVPMNKISTLLYCDASNVTGIIDRLLTNNLISREENPKDRRVKMIALTDEGSTLRQELVAHIAQYESGALNNLNEDEKQQLQVLVLKALQEPTKAKK